MNVNLNQSILDLDDKPVPANDKTKEPLSLGEVCVVALLAQGTDETLSGEAKSRHLGMALLLKSSMKSDPLGTVDLSAEEIVLLKNRIAKFYTTLVSGRAWMMLEGK